MNQTNPVKTADPYDCSDMAVPDVYDKVNEMLPSWIQAWRDLDDRKISSPMMKMKIPSASATAGGSETTAAESEKDHRKNNDGGGGGSSDTNDAEKDSPPFKKPKTATATAATPGEEVIGGEGGKVVLAKKPYWYEKHIRLPENFDYTNQRPPPSQDDDDDDDDGGDRVVSLMDGSTSSYEYELWHLFRSIPTCRELERTLTEGMTLPHTQALYQTMSQQFRRQSLDTTASSKYGLYALRMRDRHDYPRPLPPTTTSRFHSENNDDDDDNDDNINGSDVDRHTSDLVGTITLELWRTPCDDRSQPTPDSSRMVLEFLGTQTLLDVHRAIVDLTQDKFWHQHVRPQPQQRQRQQQHQNQVGDDKNNEIGESKEEEKKEEEEITADSGFFFVEGTFYTIGSTDYVTPIEEWLKSGQEHQRIRRATYLGLTPPSSTHHDAIPQQRMAKIPLELLPVRLGTRYAHVHHGDVECSLFVVDFGCHRLFTSNRSTDQGQKRQHGRRNQSIRKWLASFPLIHDIWTPNYPTPPECQACQRRLATVVTSTYCELTNGHKALCQVCATALGIPRNELQDYSVWHSQSDLSLRAAAGRK
ncbi:hypothetical protein ACA910_008131 [Epithemia clementina (nom. ined.)]